jgi:primase-polymerase (primpol)-like protein
MLAPTTGTRIGQPACTPSAPTFNVVNIPDYLKALDHWALWRPEWDGKRWQKVPYSFFFLAGSPEPLGHGRAKPNDPSTWMSYDLAFRMFEVYGSRLRFPGLCFFITEDGDESGTDFDDCITPLPDGWIEVDPWVLDQIQRLDTYAELSWSRTGVKTIQIGKKPGTRCRWSRPGGVGVEIYDKVRMFALTGNRFPGAPLTVNCRQNELTELYDGLEFERTSGAARPASPRTRGGGGAPRTSRWEGPVWSTRLSDDEVVLKARGAANGWKFKKFYDDGDLDGYPSQNEADLALCSLIAFFTGPNPDHIDRLFRKGKLMRPKWDRQDYRDRTIAQALANVRTHFGGRQGGLR